MKKLYTKICIVCGKKFAKPYYCGLPEWKTRKFCSHSCVGKSCLNGKQTRFVKGQKSFNPIKKGQHLSVKTEFKKGQKVWNEGRRWTLAERKKIADGLPKRFGKNSGNWKGGITSDPDYWAIAKAKRKTMVLKNGGSHTLQEWKDLKKKYHYTCLHCKKREPEILLTQDHIIPLSKGGSNDIGNIQPLCKRCNSVKNAKIL